jgi:hypothetical protein
MDKSLTLSDCALLTLKNQGLLLPFNEASLALKRLVAVQSQYHESLLLSLRARCGKIKKEELEKKLWEEKEWVKTWSFRWTLHGFHRDDWALITAAVGKEHNARLLYYFKRDLHKGESDLDLLNKRFIEILAETPMTREEMDPYLENVRFVSKAWGTDMKSASFLGYLVCAGTKNGKAQFASRYQWLPALLWPDIDPFEAKRKLFLRYLEGYGPASLQDFAYWSALPMDTVREVYHSVGDICVSYAVEGQKQKVMMLKESESFLNCKLEAQECLLLPKFDALLLGYKHRERFIPDAFSKRVHRPAGHVEAVYLLNGKVSGTWRKKDKGATVLFQIEPFYPHTKKEKHSLSKQFEALSEFIGYTKYLMTE